MRFIQFQRRKSKKTIRDPVSSAEGQQGLFTARQAVQAGYDERNHPYHVKSGNWVKEHRGIYRLKNFPYFPDSQFNLWSLWSCNKKSKFKEFIPMKQPSRFIICLTFLPPNCI